MEYGRELAHPVDAVDLTGISPPLPMLAGPTPPDGLCSFLSVAVFKKLRSFHVWELAPTRARKSRLSPWPEWFLPRRLRTLSFEFELSRE
jgi:hypothetical protein